MMDKEDSKKDLSLYYLSICNEFDSKWKQLSHILGDSHYPSVGNHVESLLRNAISKFLPSQYSIGTGFVLFPKKEACTITHTVSKQLDIIIYKNTDTAPIYKDGQFVVVVPESVVAILEVKSALSYSDLDSIFDLYQDYCEKHLKYINDFSLLRLEAPAFFSYSLKKDGDSPSAKNIMNSLRKRLISYIEHIESNDYRITNVQYYSDSILNLFGYCPTGHLPPLGGFYVYNEYEIIPQKNMEIVGEPAKGKCAICQYNGRHNNTDITFVHMLLRILSFAKIPFNGAVLSINDGTNSTYLDIIDIYNYSDRKIMT